MDGRAAVVDVCVAGVESLGGVGSVRHLLEALALLLREVVPPHGALFVELLDLLVDELVGVLALVLGPAGLDEDAVGCVLLLTAVLRHVVVVPAADRLSERPAGAGKPDSDAGGRLPGTAAGDDGCRGRLKPLESGSGGQRQPDADGRTRLGRATLRWSGAGGGGTTAKATAKEPGKPKRQASEAEEAGGADGGAQQASSDADALSRAELSRAELSRAELGKERKKEAPRPESSNEKKERERVGARTSVRATARARSIPAPRQLGVCWGRSLVGGRARRPMRDPDTRAVSPTHAPASPRTWTAAEKQARATRAL